jgi:hypothetical protein
MQTFLPAITCRKSAKLLDRSRLGKQRVECKQILDTLLGFSTAWKNHPAVNMWRGYEKYLYKYMKVINKEWKRRGYNSEKTDQNIKVLKNYIKYRYNQKIKRPDWYSLKTVRMYKSLLNKKKPDFYHFNVPEVEFDWTILYNKNKDI